MRITRAFFLPLHPAQANSLNLQQFTAATQTERQRRDDCCFVDRTGLAVSEINFHVSLRPCGTPRARTKIFFRFNDFKLQLQLRPSSYIVVRRWCYPGFAWKDAGVQKREYHNPTGGQVPEPVRRGVGEGSVVHSQLLELRISSRETRCQFRFFSCCSSSVSLHRRLHSVHLQPNQESIPLYCCRARVIPGQDAV